jgi:EAL domain-containing protein (putative c-di-GMP-specific phosphodiesterase class I)
VQLGCDFAQGFLWAPALPAAEFAAFVRAHELQPVE